MKYLFGIVFCSIILGSCATDKVNLSPFSNNLTQVSSKTPKQMVNAVGTNVELIKYTAELTNTTSSFPKFSDEDVNKEISRLKFNVSEYVYAVKEFNRTGKEKAFYNYENSYKKIQRLRNRLSPDEQNILNRFMVNIKTNITLVESLKSTP